MDSCATASASLIRAALISDDCPPSTAISRSTVYAVAIMVFKRGSTLAKSTACSTEISGNSDINHSTSANLTGAVSGLPSRREVIESKPTLKSI